MGFLIKQVNFYFPLRAVKSSSMFLKQIWKIIIKRKDVVGKFEIWALDMDMCREYKHRLVVVSLVSIRYPPIQTVQPFYLLGVSFSNMPTVGEDFKLGYEMKEVYYSVKIRIYREIQIKLTFSM